MNFGDKNQARTTCTSTDSEWMPIASPVDPAAASTALHTRDHDPTGAFENQNARNDQNDENGVDIRDSVRQLFLEQQQKGHVNVSPQPPKLSTSNFIVRFNRQLLLMHLHILFLLLPTLAPLHPLLRQKHQN